MRYILKVSYNGKNYCGFQIQKDKDTIQKRLEETLSIVLQRKINIVACGRTDAGVSAICAVCHFDVDENITCNKVLSYVNSLLPNDISVLEISLAPNDFHARFSAKKKTYEYYFYYGMKNAVYEEFAVHIAKSLQIENMNVACKSIVGTYDFSCFCASNTDVKDKTRTIYNCEIVRVNDNLYKMVICGNGFLYNMVRIIMGTIVLVGMGKIDTNDLIKILDSKDRSKAGKTMRSKGLLLKNVEY